MSRQKQNFNAGPHLALIAVQVIFGTWGIPAKIALRQITPFGLSGIRVITAALAFLGIARLTQRFKPIARKHWPLLIASSMCGITFNQWLFVTGLARTTVVNSVLITTTLPVFTLVIGALAGIERPSLRRAVGILLAAAGVIYLISPARSDASAGSRFGDLLILGSSFIYGCYIVLSKPLVEEYGTLPTITWIFIVATIPTATLGAISLTHVSLRSIDGTAWTAIVYIILIPTVAAYYLITSALKDVPPSTVAVYIYLQPLIAFLVAPKVLGEAFTMRTVIAAVLVFAGVAITTRRRRPPKLARTEVEITRP